MGSTLSCFHYQQTGIDINTNNSNINNSKNRRNNKMATAIATKKASFPTSILACVSRLQELEINFLAIDFDQTILDVHTGGQWKGTLDELLPHVRPIYIHLIQAAIASNIKVGVVTFSPQISMIRGVLDHIVGIEVSQTIPIRGGDRSWQYNGDGPHKGKQPHMASAVEELETKNSGLQVTKSTTLLLDDDANNIRYALKDNTRAIWFNPKRPNDLLKDITRLI